MIGITVFDGVATLKMEAPVFVGTTGQGEPGARNFPILGASLTNFTFSVDRGDQGTLVFDHYNPEKRKALSATFFQYRWDGHKLEVSPGLNLERFEIQDDVQLNPIVGLYYVARKPSACYHTFRPKGVQVALHKLVSPVDLLKFLEGKIDRAELDTQVIE